MPYIRKRGDTWSFTIDTGKDPRTGRRRQKTVSGFKSEKEAMREALKLEQQVERGQRVGAPKLADFMDTFFEDHVKHQVSTMTYYYQKHTSDKFIIPKFGDVQMDKITSMHLESYFSELIKQDIHRGTIRNISLVLRKAFRAAQKWNIIHMNPMQNAKTPKYKAQTMKVWTTGQVQEFLGKVTDQQNQALYLLALTSGMRCGEMLGLHWTDVDYTAGTVTVRRSLKYVLSEGLNEKEPKNANSRRTISLPASTIDTLKRLKEASIPSKYIFHTFGEPLYPSEVSRRFQSDVKKSGMLLIRFHDMRHTHATLLLQMGINPKVVAERLGHSTVTTTLDTYTHVLPNMQSEVAAALERQIFE